MATQAQLDQEALIRRQDELRPYRQFMSLVAGFQGIDSNTYTGTDTIGTNPTGQFVSVGPYGMAVEGQPIAVNASGQTVGPGTVSPMFIMVALAAVAVLLLK